MVSLIKSAIYFFALMLRPRRASVNWAGAHNGIGLPTSCMEPMSTHSLRAQILQPFNKLHYFRNYLIQCCYEIYSKGSTFKEAWDKTPSSLNAINARKLKLFCK
ncbi:hypothetical protein BpHYR1_046721 [Brachionus plicatilis]|uniref:Uncharacterized protein n=1 Tax=Brachionus plicatilis TaxID=10195 RepID=A0A3M7SDW0_BRAPC|nr:hypothetical protein BpHYR1_046721 [Brachionus plicatilis]